MSARRAGFPQDYPGGIGGRTFNAEDEKRHAASQVRLPAWRSRMSVSFTRCARPALHTPVPTFRSLAMTRSTRYDAIDFTPPKGAALAASRGLKLREAHGRGGTAVGVARARDLASQTTLSPATVRRMTSYFARHEVDKQGKDWGSRTHPSAGYIAWQLWGGDAGKRWAERTEQRMRKAEDK
jgi:hypothetical protein